MIDKIAEESQISTTTVPAHIGTIILIQNNSKMLITIASW